MSKLQREVELEPGARLTRLEAALVGVLVIVGAVTVSLGAAAGFLALLRAVGVVRS